MIQICFLIIQDLFIKSHLSFSNWSIYFKKVENKWKVDYKWEMIAIFIVFALTGSAAGKLAGPLVHWIGLDSENVHAAIYWTLRILLILNRFF